MYTQAFRKHIVTISGIFNHGDGASFAPGPLSASIFQDIGLLIESMMTGDYLQEEGREGGNTLSFLPGVFVYTL